MAYLTLLSLLDQVFLQGNNSKKDTAVIAVTYWPAMSGRTHPMVSFSCAILEPLRVYTHHITEIALAAEWICLFLGLFILEGEENG